MNTSTAVCNETEPASTSPRAVALPRLALFWILSLSACCGLLAGLLEVGTIVVRKHTFDPNHLYGMSRHFVWLTPLTNVCIFLVLGLVGWIAGLAWPRLVRWLFPRVLCALAVLPALLAAFPRIYDLTLAIVALGTAARLVPLFERNHRVFHRLVAVSFLMALGFLTILAVSPWVGDRIKQRRENLRPLPPVGSPNVLLIVLDSVAASHLSLHGYNRNTSPTLVELAERGIRFDSAQAPSPWTLPSHATMFTGRWLHELSVGWLTPLAETPPTLAEFLGSNGYATTGFVANTTYCASHSGLGRGFTRYQDFIFPALTLFKSSELVKRFVTSIKQMADVLKEGWALARLQLGVERLERWLDDDRKEAEVVNREFLDWLSRRAQPERPFLAFLNYFDAHYPYELPTGHLHRFGAEPSETGQSVLIRDWFSRSRSRTRLAPQEVAFAVAAYDDCIADLDEQLGRMVDELGRRGLLKQTWLIIVADHGESFGEHAGVFCHGSSLYQTEVHVPLVIVPPGGTATKQVVKEAVSLRDLAATIVDLTGQAAGSPFPGRSLARFWTQKSPADPIQHALSGSALAEVAFPTFPISRDFSNMPRLFWPQGALTEGDWSYIRREGELREELFDLREDAKEQHNLAGDRAAQPTLERMRTRLGRVTAGPLVPSRFSP